MDHTTVLKKAKKNDSNSDPRNNRLGTSVNSSQHKTQGKPVPSVAYRKKLSKALSWVLRHSAPQLNLTLSTDGYVPIKALLSCNARNLNSYTLDNIKEVVKLNDKQRFRIGNKMIVWHNIDPIQLNYSFITKTGKEEGNMEFINKNNEGKVREELCIRANQGHSIKGIIASDELLTQIPHDELKTLTIIHGTYLDAWGKHIKHEGLKKMKRNHIHFASGLPGKEGVISGMRKSCQVYIYIDGGICVENGIKFYKSDNGVILTSGNEVGTLPCSCFSRVINSKTGENML